MGNIRDDVVQRLWRGQNPFVGFPRPLYEVDLQGWGDNHVWLVELIDELRPRVALEMGVWKGASVVRMATRMQELQIDGVVIAVDTWLGSTEHWINDLEDLAIEGGRPALQRKFMNNVVACGLTDYVVPLPLDSLNAANLLARVGICLDLMHLDGGHDHAVVSADLRAWWPLIRPGGVLLGDDYYMNGYMNGAWPGVKQAFDEFFSPRPPSFREFSGKCRISRTFP